MSLASHLDQVISEISKMAVPAQAKSECEELCRYVRHQALCHSDRRDKSSRVAVAVELLIRKLQEVAFITTYKNSNLLLNELKAFIGHRGQKLVVVRDQSKSADENWTPKDLFKHLLDETKKIEAFADRDELRKGLEYLLEQSATPKYQRQHEKIKEVWIYDVHPLLSGYKLLAPFRENKTLRDRLNYLIRGEK